MLDKFRAADEKARQATINGIGAMAPKARISPTASQVAQTALAKTIAALTDGDIKIPTVQQQEGTALAPEAFAALVGFEQLIDGLTKAGVPEAKKYALDAKLAASDDDRLVEAAQLIIAAGKDSALAAAVKRAPQAAAPPPAAAPAPAPAPEGPSPADEVVAAMAQK